MGKNKEYANPVKEKTHWQMDVSNSVFPKYREDKPGDAFLARSGSKRSTTHIKINECDH